jgi:2-polyprenyl-6-methoxyphenol hydroxylase-like FAD-dependent oxidoreductase
VPGEPGGRISTTTLHEKSSDPPIPPAATSVLIVGAGPVGSALAIDLRLRGVPCVLVEKVVGITYDMRAMNNDMRTMEHFRRWGIEETHRACSPVPPAFQRDLVFCSALHGHELGVFRAYGFRQEDARPLAAAAAQPLSQKFTNRVLRRRAEELGAIVAEGWECTGVEQSSHGVEAQVVRADGSGGECRIRALFAAGCDGGRSTVTAAAGISRSGAGGLGKHLHVVVRTPALLEELPISPGAFYIVFNERAGGLVLPSDLDEFNLHLTGFGVDEDTSGLDLLAIARAVIGRDAEVLIESVSPYIVHELVADTYRVGRIVVAGDAAHMFCPFGGLNMNSGISDAANLGWKLAACLEGWGGEGLLDSYTDERRPLGLANCQAATANLRALTATVHDVLGSGVPAGETPEADAARRQLGKRLYEQTYPEWNTAGLVLDQRYDGSEIVVDDGSPPPAWDVAAYVPSARPGHRAPHVWCEDGRSLYDRFGPGFTLLRLGEDEGGARTLTKAAAFRGVPIDVLRLDSDELLDLYEAPLVLVRPDQHVAWRGDAVPADPLAVIDAVRGARTVATGDRRGRSVTDNRREERLMAEPSVLAAERSDDR